MQVTPDKLSDVMEFDHVIQVHEDGTITEPTGVYAPNLRDDELDSDEWTLMNGYSGQDRYRGPIMHNSEFIGGRMAQDVLATPGYYVAIAAYWSPPETIDVEVTYKFVVAVPPGYSPGDVSEAVQGYINSVGYALDEPLSVVSVNGDDDEGDTIEGWAIAYRESI